MRWLLDSSPSRCWNPVRGAGFDLLEKNPGLDASAIAFHLGGNEGHIRVALRLLYELGCLDGGEKPGGYTLTPQSAEFRQLPGDIQDLIAFALSEFPRLQDPRTAIEWLSRCRRGWDGASGKLKELLNGLLLCPLLVEIHSAGGMDKLHCTDELLEAMHDAYREMGWAEAAGGSFLLTEAGQYISKSGAILGTVASYAPMLRQVDHLLFGNPRDVFVRDFRGREGHLDRTLNVESSGAQRQSYFQEVTELICPLFDDLPLEAQPRYIADTGCGDGSLLRKVYETIRQRTVRGRSLAAHPLQLIAIDFNDLALASALKRSPEFRTC